VVVPIFLKCRSGSLDRGVYALQNSVPFPPGPRRCPAFSQKSCI
jgi:hypothetical protein